MEGGGKREAAGPSSASGVIEDEKKQVEMNDKAENVEVKKSDVNDDDDDEEGHQNHDANEADGGTIASFVPGPLLSLKDQIEKDKEDESLRRWKEKLLGCLESDLNASLFSRLDNQGKSSKASSSSGKAPTQDLPLPLSPRSLSASLQIGEKRVAPSAPSSNVSPPKKHSGPKQITTLLKQGRGKQVRLSSAVKRYIMEPGIQAMEARSSSDHPDNIWFGLHTEPINKKAGTKQHTNMDRSKGMLGTFAPQREPYIHTLEEETTPSGVLARGKYTAKLRFEDDDKRCHMELNYAFEISKSR